MPKIKSKVVYIIGAGFSIEAKAPSQEKLVSEIFELHKNEPHIFKPNKINEFKGFLSGTLNIPPNLQSTIPLEDIFTPLDSCIANNVSFKNLSVDTLKQKRQLIFELIGLTLERLLESSNKQYINDFAKFLVETSKRRISHNYRKTDPISVIQFRKT